MSVRTQFEGFIEFAAKDRYRWRSPEDGQQWIDEELRETVFILADAGDPDLYCFKENDKFVIRDYDRGSFSKPQIATDRLEDIEKYLSFWFGAEVRRHSGLPRIEFVFEPVMFGSEVGGFRVGGSPRNVVLLRDENGITKTISELGEVSAGRFVRYSAFSAEEIRSSFLAEDGGPLFRSPGIAGKPVGV